MTRYQQLAAGFMLALHGCSGSTGDGDASGIPSSAPSATSTGQPTSGGERQQGSDPSDIAGSASGIGPSTGAANSSMSGQSGQSPDLQAMNAGGSGSLSPAGMNGGANSNDAASSATSDPSQDAGQMQTGVDDPAASGMPMPEPDAQSSGGSTSMMAECGVERLEPGGEAFDCGDAHIFEDHGRPDNRVNHIIVADGYTEAELDTALVDHVENRLYHPDTGMFSEIGQPYLRYRNFINVCALRTPSNDSGVDGPGGNPDRDTAFDGGNCGDRLGCVDERKVMDYLGANLPKSVDADWVAATLNENEWWNSGGRFMVWSGKYMETSAPQAASVALHEGGHAFHQLADEYADDNLNCDCSAAREPNVACESAPMLTSESKWGEWIGFDMQGGGRLWNLGEHGAFEGGRYCGPTSGVTRPTQDSEMNLLPYAFNMPSIQKAIHDIYEIVRPIDAHTPNDAPVTDAGVLQLRLVDPEVLKVDWSMDGEMVSEDSGECFSLEGLPSGQHTISARVYDDTPWVRDSREDLEQTVEWTVVIP